MVWRNQSQANVLSLHLTTGLKKATKNLSHKLGYLVQDFNPGPLEYEAKATITQPQSQNMILLYFIPKLGNKAKKLRMLPIVRSDVNVC
jgi:hypothetical protein